MDEETTKIHITDSLTSSKIVELMDEYPNLKCITCSPSIYKRISKTYLEVLSELDIKVAVEYNWGAKSKSEEDKNKVLSLFKEGKTAREISEILEMTLNRVYYLIRKNNENLKCNDYKRKHDLNKRNLIKSMKNDGHRPKDIAFELDIPLRTVYYILNNK